MLASKSRAGSATTVRATQATFQMLNSPSSASTRPPLPSRKAKGKVIATVVATASVTTKAASRLGVMPPNGSTQL